jgi:type IV secretory pathway TraG/TraD family ATPase VirD4
MQGLAGLLSILAGGWFAWNFGGSLSWAFGWTQSYWLGPVLVFFASYLTINAIFSSVLSVLQLAGGGIWTASPIRWIVGKFAFVLLFAVAVWVVSLFLRIAGINWDVVKWWAAPSYVPQPPHLAEWQTWVNRDNHPLIGFAAYVGILAVTVAVAKLMQWERNAAAYLTRPLRNLWRSMKTGVGGSAVFMGLLDEWEPKMQWKPGRIMLGTSLYEPGQRLGKWDDRHIVTMATTRSGKGLSCIIPNLLTWPGSALVIDPKGENAAVTARARRQLGQSVHIVDPFKLLETERPHGLGLDPAKFPRHRLNPLAEINPDDIEAVEQVRNLAAALVMISPHANPFWDNASRVILAGVIAHVMSSPTPRTINDTSARCGTMRRKRTSEK